MASKVRLSPGIEINEIDKSQYNLTDYSVVDTTSLIVGFSDKGQAYNLQWINSKQALIDQYGYPTTEFERYFYNGATEILNRGGVLLASKIPYSNDSTNCYSACTFKISSDNYISSSIYNDDLQSVDTSIKKYATFSNVISKKYISQTVTTVNDFRLAQNKIGDILAHGYNVIDINNICANTDDIYKKLMTSLDPETLSNLQSIRFSTYSAFDTINSDETAEYIYDAVVQLSTLDKYLTREQQVEKNTITIVDITKSKYDTTTILSSNSVATTLIDSKCECLGLMPVLVTPMNALYYQQLVQSNNISAYEPISNIRRRLDRTTLNNSLGISYQDFMINFETQFIGSSVNDVTISQIVSQMFPEIMYKDTNYLKRDYLKQIGIILLKVYKDYANDNKINFALVESFVGSLDKTALDENGKSIFIDDIVNSNSNYIKVFSNIQLEDDIDIISINNQIGTVLGFTEAESLKNIEATTILQSLDVILNKAKDINTINIDILVDAGLTTIAQAVQYCSNNHTYQQLYDIIKNDTWFENWQLTSRNDTKMWNTVVSKYDLFCKNQRKDCMFLVDGPRNFCLNNNEKIVRQTDLSSSVQASLIPKLKFIINPTTSYGAGYINWFNTADDYSGKDFWCPPSIKAAGMLTYIDTYFHSWDAPAGMTRGIVNNVFDVAFNPTDDEAGRIYQTNWNYAKSYPTAGIVFEGQKTFQQSPSALDRINVRRLLLTLEKQARLVAKYFVYENNTEYVRQKFVDQLTPIFEAAVSGNAIKDYKILCDTTLNTAEVIDNNMLKCRIGIKPIKTIEWIILDFVCTNQSLTVAEQITY